MSLAKTADDKLLAFGGYGGRVKIVNLTGPTPTMIGNIATVSSNLIEAWHFRQMPRRWQLPTARAANGPPPDRFSF